MSKKTEKVFFCNIELALDVIGGKWKPLIIYHLSNNEAIRFGEFKRLIPNINERVLSRALKELEKNKIITRHDYFETPPRVDYSLSKTGEQLSPIIMQLGEWGKTYHIDFDYGVVSFDNKYDDEKC